MPLLKKVLKIILILALTGAVSAIGFIAYLGSSYNQAINQRELNRLVVSAKKAPKLPKEFNNIYFSLRPCSGIKKNIFNSLIKKPSKPCPCTRLASINRLQLNTNSPTLSSNHLVAGLQLENRLTQQQCLNLLLEQYDFIYHQIGIRSASKFYFQKPLEQLTQKECLELIAMMDNPILYNPKKYPHKFKRKVKFLEAILHKKAQLKN